MRLLTLLALAIPLAAQDLRVTAQTLSNATTSSMFGRLPKAVTAAAVQICNQTAAAQTVPLGRVQQQSHITGGITILPHDVAFTVIAAAQGSSAWSRIYRGSVAAVELVAIGATWSHLSAAVANTLTSVALAGGSSIGVLSTAIPTHTYLTFDHEALSDPLQIPAAGCVSGVVLVESDSTAKSMDFSMPLPVKATLNVPKE